MPIADRNTVNVSLEVSKGLSLPRAGSFLVLAQTPQNAIPNLLALSFVVRPVAVLQCDIADPRDAAL